MAYYSYKEVRDLIPTEFVDNYKTFVDPEYEGESNYDGDMWSMTACYISYLQDGAPEDVINWLRGYI